MSKERDVFFENIAQTNKSGFNIEVSKAEGIQIFDKDGKSYIDFISGISVSNLGHRNPKIVAAVKSQLDKYMHVMVYGEYVQKPQTDLAKLLSDNLPESLSCTYFVNSGSEAVDGALKLAKLVTKRSEIMSCKGSYHGSTLGAVSIIGDEKYKKDFRPLLPDVNYIEFNSMGDIDKISSKTACVIIEPIQAATGIRVPDIEYIKALREKCTETGALLIFDEIQTGFGRTGKLFAFENFDVTPDILTLAKGMGGGMPIGAFVSSREYMDSLDSGHPLLGHATTFGGHPVSCAAAHASLQILTTESYISDISEKHNLIKENLKHSAIKEIRGVGFHLALELGDSKLVNKVKKIAKENGLLLNGFLFNDTSVSLAPPLTITEYEIKYACRILVNALKECL